MDQDRRTQSLTDHYRRPDLAAILREAIAKSAKTIQSYQDTAAFDEFHMRGREATRELARLADMSTGDKVLDLGCGLGGPARMLAAEFGCTVTGIDLMAEYIEAAEMLTDMVGLAHRVTFRQGDMQALPFADSRFDVVWSQHTLMNIADKPALFEQIHRVLTPEGKIALYEVVAGNVAPRHYPVQWATDPSMDHLIDGDTLLAQLAAAGFVPSIWQDTTAACRQWFEAIQSRMADRPKDAPPPLGLNLVIGPTTAEKAKNTVRNLKEDRIRVVYGVLEKD